MLIKTDKGFVEEYTTHQKLHIYIISNRRLRQIFIILDTALFFGMSVVSHLDWNSILMFRYACEAFFYNKINFFRCWIVQNLMLQLFKEIKLAVLY